MWLDDKGRARDIVGVGHNGLAGHPEIEKARRVWKGTTVVGGHGGFTNSAAAEEHSFWCLLFVCSS